MDITRVTACVALTGSLVACAGDPLAGAPVGLRVAPPCADEIGEDLKACRVNVTVEMQNGQRVIVLDPPERIVDASIAPVLRRVVWVIQTDGYSFKDDSAVTLKGGSGGEFTDLEKKSDRRFRLKVKTRWWNLPFCRDYGIKIYSTSGEELSIDPTIANSYGLMDFAVRTPGARPTGVCK
jgi:hypothetical protein